MCKQLKNVRLNEGLEVLGAKQVTDGKEFEGEVFAYSAVESVLLPSTLKRVEAGTFRECKYLKSIDLPDNVEYIGSECFCNSGIEQATLPIALRDIGENAFRQCEKLKIAWVEGDCADRIRSCVDESVAIIQVTQKTVGGKLLFDIRRQKDVVIPEGVQEIGE